MPEEHVVVMNTGPVLALVSALGDLKLLEELYDRVVIPRRVAEEILVGGSVGFGVDSFLRADFLDVQSAYCRINPFLQKSLDPGEAAVIQTACDKSMLRVCIDEATGRRIARLYGLSVTGSLGVLIKAIKEGKEINLKECVEKMRRQGVWISDQTIKKALDMI